MNLKRKYGVCISHTHTKLLGECEIKRGLSRSMWNWKEILSAVAANSLCQLQLKWVLFHILLHVRACWCVGMEMTFTHRQPSRWQFISVAIPSIHWIYNFILLPLFARSRSSSQLANQPTKQAASQPSIHPFNQPFWFSKWMFWIFSRSIECIVVLCCCCCCSFSCHSTSGPFVVCLVYLSISNCVSSFVVIRCVYWTRALK